MTIDGVFELPWVSLARRPAAAAMLLERLCIENYSPQWPTAVLVGALFAGDDDGLSRWFMTLEASGLAAFYRRHSPMPIAWEVQRHAGRADLLDNLSDELQSVLGHYNAQMDLALQHMPDVDRQFGHVIRNDDGEARVCIETDDDAILIDVPSNRLDDLGEARAGSAFTVFTVRRHDNRQFVPAIQRSMLRPDKLERRNRRVADYIKDLSSLDNAKRR